MIPNQWYAILDSKEVKRGRPVGVTRMGEKMVLWRDPQGEVTCMSDLCPHRGAALSIGKLKEGCVECPFHGFLFDSSGTCRLIPANGKNAVPPKAFQVRTYPTREEHGFIYIWWGQPQPDLPPAPFFDNVDDRVANITVTDHWNAHYSRVIENQLDVVHLPFVHYNTIGRGNKTLVNGPITRLTPKPGSNDLLEIWVSNQVDQGQTPLKPSQMPEADRRPFLQFRFPNLWHNWISDDYHLVVAFAPIDDENTLLYLRTYQTVARLPVLRELFNLFSAWGSIYIERQDKRVVVTQRPKASDLRMGEKMIQGDGPIIEYRRRRRELTDCAQPGQAQILQAEPGQ